MSTTELGEFRQQHGLSPGQEDDAGSDVDLRDEIEAEIEAAAAEEAERKSREDAERGDSEDDEEDSGEGDDEESDGGEAEGRPRRRRRRGRRGGRGRGKSELEGTFDHGERDGFGLWLDPAIQDSPIYSEHWAGKREVAVKVEAGQIVITRAGDADRGDGDSDD